MWLSRQARKTQNNLETVEGSNRIICAVGFIIQRSTCILVINGTCICKYILQIGTRVYTQRSRTWLILFATGNDATRTVTQQGTLLVAWLNVNIDTEWSDALAVRGSQAYQLSLSNFQHDMLGKKASSKQSTVLVISWCEATVQIPGKVSGGTTMMMTGKCECICKVSGVTTMMMTGRCKCLHERALVTALLGPD